MKLPHPPPPVHVSDQLYSEAYKEFFLFYKDHRDLKSDIFALQSFASRVRVRSKA